MSEIQELVRAILFEYPLPVWGTHGIGHWARVLENGFRLAESTGADKKIVELFAVFHDSKRENEGTDKGHGRRGAAFAATLRNRLFWLDDGDFDKLTFACAHHTDGALSPDITIQTCWDADRLDLGRVGKTINPEMLGTPAAKDRDMIRWADERGRKEYVPALIKKEWGVEL